MSKLKSFESAYQQLEQWIRAIEQNEVTLEDMEEIHKKAQELLAECEKQLRGVQERVNPPSSNEEHA